MLGKAAASETGFDVLAHRVAVPVDHLADPKQELSIDTTVFKLTLVPFLQ